MPLNLAVAEVAAPQVRAEVEVESSRLISTIFPKIPDSQIPEAVSTIDHLAFRP